MEILLVYMMTHVVNPQAIIGPQVSDRIFTSAEECADFVNTLAGGDVVKENRFRFAAQDGVIFHGGCMTPMEYEIYKEDLTNLPKGA